MFQGFVGWEVLKVALLFLCQFLCPADVPFSELPSVVSSRAAISPVSCCACRSCDCTAVCSEAVWGASPIPAAQPVALFARPDQEFSCRCYGILISVGFL